MLWICNLFTKQIIFDEATAHSLMNFHTIENWVVVASWPCVSLTHPVDASFWFSIVYYPLAWTFVFFAIFSRFDFPSSLWIRILSTFSFPKFADSVYVVGITYMLPYFTYFCFLLLLVIITLLLILRILQDEWMNDREPCLAGAVANSWHPWIKDLFPICIFCHSKTCEQAAPCNTRAAWDDRWSWWQHERELISLPHPHI